MTITRDEDMEKEGMSPECPECDKQMTFVKRKLSTKEWPDEDGYSDWKCRDCKDTHRLFDNGDCEVR